MLVTDGFELIDTSKLKKVDEKVISDGVNCQILKDEKSDQNYFFSRSYNAFSFAPTDSETVEGGEYSVPSHRNEIKDQLNVLLLNYFYDSTEDRPNGVGTWLFGAADPSARKSINLYAEDEGNGYYLSIEELNETWTQTNELPADLCLLYAASLNQQDFSEIEALKELM